MLDLGAVDFLLHSGSTRKAVDLVITMARNGHPEAFHRLALWSVTGDVIARDFSSARELFGRAAAEGHALSAVTHAVFVALGVHCAADWNKAVRQLRAWPSEFNPIDTQIAIIESMTLNDIGAPVSLPAIDWLSSSPRVGVVRGLFTAAECAHAIALAYPLLSPSSVVDPASGKLVAHPIRTSDGAVLGPVQQDLVIHALNRRIACTTHSVIERGEPVSILRYRPGQQYRLHHDCLPNELNQRTTTIIVLLNDNFEGGATQFPDLGLSIRVKTGDAIVFDNVTSSGSPDRRSRHAGSPVTRGSKWIYTRWIRQVPFDPWGLYGATPPTSVLSPSKTSEISTTPPA